MAQEQSWAVSMRSTYGRVPGLGSPRNRRVLRTDRSKALLSQIGCKYVSCRFLRANVPVVEYYHMVQAEQFNLKFSIHTIYTWKCFEVSTYFHKT